MYPQVHLLHLLRHRHHPPLLVFVLQLLYMAEEVAFLQVAVAGLVLQDVALDTKEEHLLETPHP